MRNQNKIIAKTDVYYRKIIILYYINPYIYGA